MVDSLVRISPNGAAPNPFRIAVRYKWLRFESPDDEEQAIFGGFAAKVRMPTYGELLAEEGALAESVEAFFTLAAPRIVAWNALAADADGNETPIPAPGEHPDNDWKAIYTLERPLAHWLLTALRSGHQTDKQRAELKKTFAASRAHGNGRTTNNNSNAPTDDA